MHLRLLRAFCCNQIPSVLRTSARNSSPSVSNGPNITSLCNSTPSFWIPTQVQSYSTDTSKMNVDLNKEIKLEDLSIHDISNPAIENIDYDAITNGDEELLSKLKFIVLETDSLFHDGHSVPSSIKTTDWQHMLTLPSRSQRMKYLNFLFKKEMMRANEKARKEARRFSAEEKKMTVAERFANTDHIVYGLQANTMFHRIYDTYMNKTDNIRAMHSIQLGPDIIVDMDYYNYMNRHEQSMLAKQLLYILSDNRLLWEPYNVIFSSFDKDSFVAQKLNALIPNMYTDDFPLNQTSKHFTELKYSKKELVYLTPHTNNVLLEHIPGSVYIIGGMVDKRITQPLSLAKAKKENIRAVKLPLDNFLDWGNGHKSLTLNQVMAIMNDWRRTNDWKYSLRHIPRRKLNQSDDDRMFLAQNEESGQNEIAKHIKERKKRQLVYDLLLKR